FITEKKLSPLNGQAVILIHGILRSSRSFDAMAARAEQAGFIPVGFNYPSTRVSVEESAEYLHRVIESLNGVTEIHFAVHSLGGLVVRAYLMKHRDPRIQRMVMIGTPNRGAEMADLLRRNYAFETIMGPAGQQLVTDSEGLSGKLPTPDFEFAIIAGARGNAD